MLPGLDEDSNIIGVSEMDTETEDQFSVVEIKRGGLAPYAAVALLNRMGIGAIIEEDSHNSLTVKARRNEITQEELRKVVKGHRVEIANKVERAA